jgi:soluble lytic murein transglycosylase
MHTMCSRSRLARALPWCLLSLQLASAAQQPPPAGGPLPTDADLESTRRAFVGAMQRIRLIQPDTPDSPALRAYAIHDYLVAARLRRDLAQKAGELDAPIDVFLQAHAGQPVERGLKHDWLASLARRGRWDQFLARSADLTDPVLACDRLAGRLAEGETLGLGAAVLARWSLPQKQPTECDEAFAWLHRQNLLTPELAEARVRAALGADNPHLARAFAVDVPMAQTPPLLLWSDLLDAPKSTLTVLAMHPGLPVESDALAAGFDKLARSDADGAFNLLPSLLARPGVTPDLQNRLQRSAALGGAYGHDPRAIAEFERLAAAAVDSQVEEWRVRAALWHGDYRKALGWIEQMPAGLATQPRWRYWRARAVAATVGEDAAAALFGEIAGLRDYYGYLAADRLHRNYILNARPAADDVKAQSAMAREAGLIRAHELFACDMTDEAAAEWNTVLGDADAAVKVQAARLAAHWGWYAESIATLAQTGNLDDVRLRYPRPFSDAVAEASRLAGVPADWIWSVMRQESLFRKDAVSHADARGLMQMLPVTAAAVARRWHLPPASKDALFNPPEAISLGAAYLRELLDRHEEQLDVSLAAYNAGSAAVARWQPPATMDADVWVENIPYFETRAYVEHIFEHIVAFAWVRDTEPPRLETLMPPVRPPAP